MAQDPAFLFYTGDFSTGTQFFTNEQVGKYLRLLMAQHQHGHLSEKQILFICGQKDDEIMQKFMQDDDGNYYNFRLETELNKRKSFSESRRNNKLGKGKGNKKQVINKSKSLKKHKEDENKDKDINKTNENEIEIFEVFRKKYGGTKRGSQTEFDNFKRHKDWKVCLPLLSIAVDNQIRERKYKESNKIFLPEWKNLQTWINQRCWEQEVGLVGEITQESKEDKRDFDSFYARKRS